MKQTQDLAETALSKVIENLTDQVFIAIENDPELLKTYQGLIAENNAKVVNSEIGRHIRTRLGLTNTERATAPQSSLIKTYQKHGLPNS